MVFNVENFVTWIELLTQPFSMEELKHVVFKMEHKKAIVLLDYQQKFVNV